jgi:hypothetical protein
MLSLSPFVRYLKIGTAITIDITIKKGKRTIPVTGGGGL